MEIRDGYIKDSVESRLEVSKSLDLYLAFFASSNCIIANPVVAQPIWCNSCSCMWGCKGGKCIF